MEQKNLYETIFIVNNSIGEEAKKALVEKFTTLISTNGKTEIVNEWGTRRLAYPINDYTDGYYVYVKFTSAFDFPAELDRIYHITDGILRSLIVKCEQ
ncbi:MAG: 30S ribosomal protein S6 [Clostridiales bacterium GWF2_36_10]|nr:MAG: 30S ribosomal protein S6 [Clostridiales bacterium GWF2_36_10]HAN21944.1 30S ribosomal protein S6 [Clostridiales bacterium]